MAAAVIGALRAELSANVGKFVGEMKTAGNAVKTFGKTAGTVATNVGLLGAAVTAVGLVGLAFLAKKLATAINLTNDSLETTGKRAITLADIGKASFSLLGDAGTAAAKYVAEAWESTSGRVLGSQEEQATGMQKVFGVTLKFLANAANFVIGIWTGVGLAIYAVFKGLGPAIADVFVGAMNAAIAAVQAGVNAIIAAVKIASGGLVDIAPVALKRVENTYKGAAMRLGGAVGFAFTEGMEVASGTVQDIGNKLMTRAKKLRDAEKKKKGRQGGETEAEKEAKRIKAATDALDKALDSADRRIDRGLDDLRHPESIEKANALRGQIEAAVQTAKEAKVPIEQFTDRIAKMNARIQELETEGLAKEAHEFALEVAKSDRAVREFARGGLAPLDAALQEVDDKYEALRQSVQKQIDENGELASRVPEAAEALAKLKAQLDALTKGHDAATAAAKSQYEAMKAIADLEAQATANAGGDALTDLRQARDGGPMGAAAKRAQELERELRDQRLAALTELKTLEADKAEAERVGDADTAARLTGLIDLQRQLYDLVGETSALQIATTERIEQAWEDVIAGTSDELSSMVADWELDIEGLRGVWKQFAKDLFIKPFMDQATTLGAGWLKGLQGDGKALGGGGFLQGIGSKIGSFFSNFAGGFAGGGTIGAGQWGVAGENGPEPVFAGSKPLHVMPNGGGAPQQVFNITTPDANSFRRSKRQVARAGAQLLGRA